MVWGQYNFFTFIYFFIFLCNCSLIHSKAGFIIYLIKVVYFKIFVCVIHFCEGKDAF